MGLFSLPLGLTNYAPQKPEPSGGLMSRISKMPGNPLLDFGLSLLAQDGWSTTPGPSGGARIANAGLNAVRMADAREDRQFERGLQTDAAALARTKAATDAQIAMRPKISTVGSEVVSSDPDTGETKSLYRGQESKPALIREMEAAGIDPSSEEGRLLIARSASGYQYSDEAQRQKIATEAAIAKLKASMRPPPVPAAAKLPNGFILNP